MCKIFEEYGDERVAEAKSEWGIELVEKLLKQNKLTLEEISDAADVSLATVEHLAQQLAIPALA